MILPEKNVTKTVIIKKTGNEHFVISKKAVSCELYPVLYVYFYVREPLKYEG